MRLTTRLSTIIVLVTALACLLMLTGCVLSFFYLSDRRAEFRLQLLAEEVDSALLLHSPDQLASDLRMAMGPLRITRTDLYAEKTNRLALVHHQYDEFDDEPNQLHRTVIPLKRHPGYSLDILWVDTTKTWLRSFVGSFTLTVLVTIAIIMTLALLWIQRWLNRQLTGMERLENRADEVLKGERSRVRAGSVYEWPPKASSAIDLLLSDLFEAGEQHNRIDTLIRAFAARDAKTGLNNRLFFDNQLATMLEGNEGASAHGMVMMIRLPDLDESEGELHVQEFLFDMVNLLSTFVMRYPGALLARYFRHDFAVLLPHRSLKDADSIASQLINALDALPPHPGLDRDDLIHIGVSAWHSGQSTQDVMDNVERATRQASLLGGNNWSVSELPLQRFSRGSVKWRTLLENTLNRGGPRLYQKPAVDQAGDVHHRVIMPRIFDGENEVLATEYLPLVQQLGMAEAYDRQMVSRIVTLLSVWPEETLAIPLTVDSLLQRGFVTWLRNTLLQCTKLQRKHILFELAEADVCQHINRLRQTLRLLQGLGCRIAITQSGLTVVSVSYIKQFNVELIKLYPGLVRTIERRTENQLLVQSLLESCKGTATRVFATGVRDKKEWRTLMALGVAGGQGDLIASLAPLSSNVKKYSQRYRV